jgi:hypothetical protein
MHDTAFKTGEGFFRCYGHEGCKILDVGSMNVNGTLREFAPKGSEYVGVDLTAGPGVDVVLTKPGYLPFPRDSFDLVISTSSLEHDPMFWLTFSEMCCVAKCTVTLWIVGASIRTRRRP